MDQRTQTRQLTNLCLVRHKLSGDVVEALITPDSGAD